MWPFRLPTLDIMLALKILDHVQHIVVKKGDDMFAICKTIHRIKMA